MIFLTDTLMLSGDFMYMILLIPCLVTVFLTKLCFLFVEYFCVCATKNYNGIWLSKLLEHFRKMNKMGESRELELGRFDKESKEMV